tara:strand:- start:35384 stop:35914 length:531 start_codon:yes stop_codon:yes gene_type:complete
MFDIETFGTVANAVVISVGAAGFDKEGKSFEYYQRIDIESQTKAGRSMNESTLLWWMDQSKEAQTVFKEDAQDTKYALDKMIVQIQNRFDLKKLEVYGNGANFDITIMENLLATFELPIPWKFWNIRCYRTIKNLFAGTVMKREGTHHNALDDAKDQLKHLQMINTNHNLKIGLYA